MYEYEARMYAFGLKEVDKQYDMHIQAWINHQVTGTKKKGKKEEPVFKKFEDFFDYDKQVKEIKGEDKKDSASERSKRIARAFSRIGKEGKTS